MCVAGRGFANNGLQRVEMEPVPRTEKDVHGSSFPVSSYYSYYVDNMSLLLQCTQCTKDIDIRNDEYRKERMISPHCIFKQLMLVALNITFTLCRE